MGPLGAGDKVTWGGDKDNLGGGDGGTWDNLGGGDGGTWDNMGLINKVDMVCLSPVGYGV